MAGGWSKDGAVQEQIDSSVNEAIALARSQINQGPGSEHCEECGDEIPPARREAVPGVRYCVTCQQALDEQLRVESTFNRRGSKDSQLR